MSRSSVVVGESEDGYGVSSRDMRAQDYRHKISLPWSEQAKVLRYLDDHNINAYSILDTEEALRKTSAFRGFPVQAN